MTKAILFDGDGVSIIKQGFFSDKYAREYNVAIEKIMLFFRNEFKACQLGNSDMKKELSRYLPEWGWEKSIDDFLQYWFVSGTLPNEMVLKKIQEIRSAGIKCYLATDQEKYRAEYILKQLEFSKKFDGFFFAFELGYSKTTPEFFNVILEKLALKPDEIMLFEDDKEDLEAAAQLGIKTKLYKDLKDLDNIENNDSN